MKRSSLIFLGIFAQVACSDSGGIQTGIREQNAPYCGEVSAGSRNGDPREMVSLLSATYPKPETGFIEFDPNLGLTEFVLNSVPMYKIRFKVQPFKLQYPGDPIFEGFQSRKNATLILPQADFRKDVLVYSSAFGTSNPVGDPRTSEWDQFPDKMRSKNQVPSWFHGTGGDSDGSDFVDTYSNVASDLKIPILFYDVVPQSLIFKPDIREKLKRLQESSSENFLCDDYVCEGDVVNGVPNVVIEDTPIHQCLNNLTQIDTENRLMHFPGIYYSIAADRAIDAAEEVLNQVFGAGTFDYSEGNLKVVNFGGSKRGVFTRTSLAVSPRVAGAYSGHANAGGFDLMFRSRLRLWPTTYFDFSGQRIDDVYLGANSQLAVLRSNPDWEAAYDPYRWRPEILEGKRLFIQAGTRDTYFNSGAELYYSSSLPSHTQFLYDINYPHGSGTVDQAVSFRNFVNQVLNAAPMMQLDAHYYFDSGKVVARITGVEPTEVQLWCTVDLGEEPVISLRQIQIYNPDGSPKFENGRPVCASLGPDWHTLAPDLRYARMESHPMTKTEPGYYESQPPPALNPLYDQYRYCLVRAYQGLDGPVVTSKALMNQNLCSESLLPSVNP